MQTVAQNIFVILCYFVHIGVPVCVRLLSAVYPNIIANRIVICYTKYRLSSMRQIVNET